MADYWWLFLYSWYVPNLDPTPSIVKYLLQRVQAEYWWYCWGSSILGVDGDITYVLLREGASAATRTSTSGCRSCFSGTFAFRSSSGDGTRNDNTACRSGWDNCD